LIAWVHRARKPNPAEPKKTKKNPPGRTSAGHVDRLIETDREDYLLSA
jgi:hypothetical protein